MGTQAQAAAAEAAATAQDSHYGWVMVGLAALFMGLGSGSLGALAVFLKPLVADFGWLRGETSLAYLVGGVAMGTGGIAMGYLADRFTARPVVLAGAAALGGAYLLLATQASLAQFYAYYILMGGLGAAAFDAPLLANVGSWFDRNKGLAIGIATAGRALGQGFVPFAAGYLIVAGDWREAYLTLGVGVLAVMLPLALLIRPAPQSGSGAGAPAGSVTAFVPVGAISPRAFVAWLAVAAIFCCITMATAMVHVGVLAQDRGLSATTASTVLLVIYVGGFVGRIAFGRLADAIGGLRAYLLAAVMQTVLVFWFTRLDTPAGFYVLATLFGFGFSGVMTCAVICVREFVPPRRRGVAQGVVLFTAWIGMGLGGWQGGFCFDLTGSYTLSFANAALAGGINLVVLGALLLYVSRRPPLPAMELGTV